MKRLSRILLGFSFVAFLYPAQAQQTDTALKNKLIELYTWKVKEMPEKGNLMFVDFPYNLGNPNYKQSQYLSMSACITHNQKQPLFMSFTIPDDVIASKGLLLGFDSLFIPLSSIRFSLKKLNEVIRIGFGRHWDNNHTYGAMLRNGMITDTANGEKIDIFGKFMHYKNLYVLFYDSSGMKRMYFPLSFFQQRYKELSLSAPTYSTGNPADTALTKEEMTDKGSWSGTEPASWEIAGISDPIALKHFVKYFQYLVNHNEKEKISEIIIFPLPYTLPETKTAETFIKNFDEIFDDMLRDKINKQEVDTLFRNWHGVMIGNTPSIWIRQVSDKKFMIYDIDNINEKSKGPVKYRIK